jgi:putative methyltransferase (TIGR04325 family)
VLINHTPVYQQETAVTLHATGTAFFPYYLFNRSQFVSTFTDLGYRLVDEWASPGPDCHMPLHSGYAVNSFSGFYFAR